MDNLTIGREEGVLDRELQCSAGPRTLAAIPTRQPTLQQRRAEAALCALSHTTGSGRRRCGDAAAPTRRAARLESGSRHCGCLCADRWVSRALIRLLRKARPRYHFDLIVIIINRAARFWTRSECEAECAPTSFAKKAEFPALDVRSNLRVGFSAFSGQAASDSPGKKPDLNPALEHCPPAPTSSHLSCVSAPPHQSSPLHLTASFGSCLASLHPGRYRAIKR
ncbi:hypothetical protein L1887_48443 [Cichorium endivia]|nr:hypothetical protein L1887_48443 [Cichorium endivia]